MLIMNQSKTQVWNMPLEDIRRLEVIPGDENPGGYVVVAFIVNPDPMIISDKKVFLGSYAERKTAMGVLRNLMDFAANDRAFVVPADKVEEHNDGRNGFCQGV